MTYGPRDDMKYLYSGLDVLSGLLVNGKIRLPKHQTNSVRFSPGPGRDGPGSRTQRGDESSPSLPPVLVGTIPPPCPGPDLSHRPSAVVSPEDRDGGSVGGVHRTRRRKEDSECRPPVKRSVLCKIPSDWVVRLIVSTDLEEDDSTGRRNPRLLRHPLSLLAHGGTVTALKVDLSRSGDEVTVSVTSGTPFPVFLRLRVSPCYLDTH